MDDDTVFVGFVISLPGPDKNAWGEPHMALPRSISPCFGTLLPAMWCLDWPSWPAKERSLQERASELGIVAYGTLAEVTNEAMNADMLIAESFCQSPETIRALLALLPDAWQSVRGVGIHTDDLRTLLTVYRHAGPGPSLETLLESRPKVCSGCDWLGYELLAAEHDAWPHHSWLCNGIESIARERGYALAADTLIASYADAKGLARELTDGVIDAEPGLWLPWRIADCSALFRPHAAQASRRLTGE